MGQALRLGDFLRLARGAVNQNQMACLLEGPGRLRQQLEGLLPLAHAPALRLHAGRAVQQQHDRVRRGRKRPAQPAAGQRPGQEKDEHGHRQQPAKQNQELPQLGVAGRTARGREQKAHGRPRLGTVAQAVEQVDDDRQQHQRQSQQNDGLQKCHGQRTADARLSTLSRSMH